jgi:hypothetical protein
MVKAKVDDTGSMGRVMINIRRTTYDELSVYRREVEPGRKESWDVFFRRLMESRKLSK